MIQLQFPLHTSCNIDKSGKVWTPEAKPQILIRKLSTLCQPEWITCSYWSIIAKIRVINCWPPIGYSPHGVPPSILLVHSSFSPNYKSKDPYINLFKNVLMEKNVQIHYSNLFINDVLMKKNMNVQIWRIGRYLMVVLMHIQLIWSEAKEGHRSMAAAHDDGKVRK